jgi:hypothetical protein
VYARRQRAVTFAGGSTRTVTIQLEIPDFERLERLAVEYNVGNATLGRRIIRKYLQLGPAASTRIGGRKRKDRSGTAKDQRDADDFGRGRSTS